MSEDSLLEGSPGEPKSVTSGRIHRPRTEVLLQLLLITKNPRDGDLGRRQRWLPERVDKVIAFDRLAL